MRPVALAVLALVAIGTAESLESARQLAGLAGRGRPVLAPSGTLLTLAGFGLSTIVFIALGVALARAGSLQPAAIRQGAIAGLVAGLLGGTIRALAVSDYLGATIRGFGLPVMFLAISLAVFVVVAVIATGAAGAALTWLGFRLGRLRPRRPRP